MKQCLCKAIIAGKINSDYSKDTNINSSCNKEVLFLQHKQLMTSVSQIVTNAADTMLIQIVAYFIPLIIILK